MIDPKSACCGNKWVLGRSIYCYSIISFEIIMDKWLAPWSHSSHHLTNDGEKKFHKR